MKKRKKQVSQEEALVELQKGYSRAERVLKEPDKIEKILDRLDEKKELTQKLGDMLTAVMDFASLIKSFIKKEYREVPKGTIIAVISAVIYVVNPFDIVPDFLPGIGTIDDNAVIGVCMNLVGKDIEKYRAWRDAQGTDKA